MMQAQQLLQPLIPAPLIPTPTKGHPPASPHQHQQKPGSTGSVQRGLFHCPISPARASHTLVCTHPPHTPAHAAHPVGADWAVGQAGKHADGGAQDAHGARDVLCHPAGPQDRWVGAGAARLMMHKLSTSPLAHACPQRPTQALLPQPISSSGTLLGREECAHR